MFSLIFSFYFIFKLAGGAYSHSFRLDIILDRFRVLSSTVFIDSLDKLAPSAPPYLYPDLQVPMRSEIVP